MRQTSFTFLKNYKKEFGGSLLIGKRKIKRPLSTKHPIHLVIKSCETGVFAPGNRSLESLIRKTAAQFNIKIYDLALNWSHIHFLIRLRDQQDYCRFIRALTSLISAALRKARPQLKAVFTLRPFTRLISWGKDFRNVFSYHMLNKLESLGFISRKKQNKIDCRRPKPLLLLL